MGRVPLSGHLLLDTHALLFWQNREVMSEGLLDSLDQAQREERLWVSSICFWECSLLVKKGRIELENIKEWKNALFDYTRLRMLDVTADDMVESVQLPDLHKDPFDRLLITQARKHGWTLVTRDSLITQYDVRCCWDE